MPGHTHWWTLINYYFRLYLPEIFPLEYRHQSYKGHLVQYRQPIDLTSLPMLDIWLF